LTEKAKPKTKSKPKQPSTNEKVDKKKAVAQSNSATNPKPSFGFFRALIRMLIIVFIVGASSAGWLFWQEWQRQIQVIESHQSTIATLKSSFNLAKKQAQAVIEQQQQQKRKATAYNNQLDNIELRVNAQGRRLIELGSTTRSDWLLAEAEYLARLARQRLQTERSVKSPLALLESVDAILSQIDDPNLLAARNAVAEDIAKLRLTADIDREGMYLELQALAANIEALDLVALAEPEVIADEPVVTTTHNQTSVLDKFISDLSGLIRVRQRQNPIEPMLHQEEEHIVRRNMQMIFEQAQIALLREEQGIYQATLQKAQDYLLRFFQSNPASEAVSQRLALLLDAQIIQQLPDIYRSLDAIQSLLIMREQRLLENEATDQPESSQ
jgi:uroporphyrin-3 C-methyltransferase